MQAALTKIGRLSDAVGLAGRVPDADGKPWVFVALLNHPQPAAKGRPVLDALVNRVATQRWGGLQGQGRGWDGWPRSRGCSLARQQPGSRPGARSRRRLG